MKKKVLTSGKPAAFLAVALASLMGLALALALAGCTQLPSNGFGAAFPQNPATDESGALIVGDPESSSESATVTNRVGQSITAVSLKLSTEAEYGQPFLDQEWANDQKLQIFLSDQQAEQLAAQQAGQQDADASQALLFDIKLQLSSGVVLEIANVELYSVTTADLRIDSQTDLAYLEYQNALGMSLSTLEQSISTKAAEDALREAQEREAAEAAAQAAAEAEAAEQAPFYDYSYEPPTNGGSSQSGDVCVDDLVIR